MYTGPKRIVVVGAGVSGVAAFDALTAALAACPSLPPGMKVTLVEATEAAGGRAQSFGLDGPSARHPRAPYGVSTPHGVHFIWGSYAHLKRLMGDLDAKLVPAIGTATYCAWMAPPDLTGDRARIAPVHICDPDHPETAWNPRARKLLEAFAERGTLVKWAESLIDTLLGLHFTAHDLLCYMDILFDEENLGPELRWMLLFSRVIDAQLGEPESSPLLTRLLKKAPYDADIGDLLHPLFHQHVMPRMKHARLALFPMRITPTGHPALDLLGLLARDAAKLAATGLSWDPRASGFLKNALKAAFSNPYALDVGTVMRDAQFGLRSYEGAILRLFDGDDSRAIWEAIAERACARLPGIAEIKRKRIVRAFQTVNGAIARVDLAETNSPLPPDVPALRPAPPGPMVESLEADAVISTLLPSCLLAVLPADAPRELTHPIGELARYANETLNLQLYFPRKMSLPLVDPPAGNPETPPFSISNLEGPFTIVVDLQRGWSKAKFESIALDAADRGRPFDGTAWELVGTYPECFTFDPWAHPGRIQWPLEVQERLAAITNVPDDFDPDALDDRKWVHDTGSPGRMPQPMLGEVRRDVADDYQHRWTTVASPIVAAQAMRLLADLPGLASADATYLREEADRVEASSPTAETRFVVYRACHAENRFFSAELGLFPTRPHARFRTAIPGLWVAGDWTRNGLNLQAMESATISGLQAALGVIEAMRGAGLNGAKVPQIDPDVLPEGVWDAGVSV
jgi:hypothetical protein